MKTNLPNGQESFKELKKELYFVKTDKGAFALTEEGYNDFDKTNIIEWTRVKVTQEKFNEYIHPGKISWQEVKKKINDILENK